MIAVGGQPALSHGASSGISRAAIHKEYENACTRDQHRQYIACAALVPDCPFEATAPTEEELLTMVAAHAAHTHGITEVTPELAAKVKAAIQNRQND